MPDHVVLVIHINGSTLGLRFVSVEHLMTVQSELIEAAAKVWPDHPLMQDYLSEE